jgi:hypothetical protein
MEDNGSGHLHYRCRHRGQGCVLPRRSSRGLLRGAVLGLGLLGHDDQLREAIRQHLAEPVGAAISGRKPIVESAKALAALVEERRKLLRLHYADQIDAELFAEEQARLTAQIEALRSEESASAEDVMSVEQVSQGFEAIAAYLAKIDVPAIWEAATEQERRVLIDELLDRVEVHEDHLEVVVHGAPRLNVTLGELGLAGPDGEKRSCRRADAGVGHGLDSLASSCQVGWLSGEYGSSCDPPDRLDPLRCNRSERDDRSGVRGVDLDAVAHVHGDVAEVADRHISAHEDEIPCSKVRQRDGSADPDFVVGNARDLDTDLPVGPVDETGAVESALR